jgi:uncharacterized delta-60 repeat protein
MRNKEWSRRAGVCLALLLSVLALTATRAAVPTPVVAWGYNSDGQVTVPVAAQSAITAIAGGNLHSLALKSNGSVVAWGHNFQGQTDVPAAAQSGVIAIAASGGHSLALKSNGGVVAWGYNEYGQATVPAAAQSGVTAIAAGINHNLALKSDGSVVAWGWNPYGQTSVPAAAQSGVIAIAAGWFHSLALKSDGSVVAWGYNGHGQTTVPTTAQSGVTAIAAGGALHSLALKSNGSVVAWGSNEYGQATVPLAAQNGVSAIAAGLQHSLALKSDGSVVAWGYNGYGQTTVPAAAQSGITAIAAGWYHNLALRAAPGSEQVDLYPGPSNAADEGVKVAVGPSGNVYVLAKMGPPAHTDTFMQVIKYAPDGSRLWASQALDGGLTEIPRDLVVGTVDGTPDGAEKIYITGSTWAYSQGYNWWTARYNSDGGLEDEVTFRYPEVNAGAVDGDDHANAIALCPDGNIVVTGNSYANTQSGSLISTIKYNARTLERIWHRQYDTTGTDTGADVVVNSDGFVYVTGTAFEFESNTNTQSDDMVVLRYGPDGNVASDRFNRYNYKSANLPEEGRVIGLDGSGNVYVAGWSMEDGPNRPVWNILKYTPELAQVGSPARLGWNQTDAAPYDMVVAPDGWLYATGYGYSGSGSSNGGWNMYTAALRHNGGGWDSFVFAPYDSGGEGVDYGTGIALNGPNTVAVVGVANRDAGADLVTLRYRRGTAQPLWSARYNGPGNGGDRAAMGGVATGSNGYVYATGYAQTANEGQAVVTLTYANQAPVAQAQSVSTPEDTSKTITLSGWDGDSDGLTYSIAAGPTHGSLTGDGATRTYTPTPNYSGPDSFTFRVSDGFQNSSTATVSITVQPANDAPTGVADSYTLWKNCSLTVAAPGLFANDTDPDGDTLVWGGFAYPSHGTLSRILDGGFTYTPNPGYVGPDSFFYYVRDPSGAQGSATVTLTIQDDTARPTCQIGSVVTVPGATPVVYVPVTLADSGSGIASVQLTSNSARVKLVDPATAREVPIGGTLTYEPSVGNLVVHAVKQYHNQSARVELRVTDCAGNVTICDPVITELVIPKGARSVSQTHGGLPAAEHYVTAENRRPGVKLLHVKVNTARPELLTLKPGAKKVVDVRKAMQPGDTNSFTLTAVGAPGSKVLVIIGDSSTTGSAGGGHPHPSPAAASGVNLEFHR